MSDDKIPFRELHSLDTWDDISGALFQLELKGSTLTRVAKTARQLAAKAGTWAFLTADMEMTLDMTVSMGGTEEDVANRIADLEAWTSDRDRWMNAYIEVMDTLVTFDKDRQALYDAISGVKHDE